eukprot:TRINITY_DN11517_c3_g5_i2.p1 TRINITY_DN11517_c3_g5~~TRINITY_DN11517_c3_g5_i2.p1  ORF type:complete len:737 (+),score=138.09 TRINITY_DN11517_c3_g5_i2:92-2302(+)
MANNEAQPLLQASSSDDEARPLLQADWTCPQCTLENKAKDLCCGACSLPKPSPFGGKPKPTNIKPPKRGVFARKPKKREYTEEERRLIEKRKKPTDAFYPQAEEPSPATILFTEPTDPHFPPAVESLFINKKCRQDGRKSPHITWRRFADTELDGYEPCLFAENASSEHVTQGQLGNCWFVSAMAVVAQQPDLIRRLVQHDVLSPSGHYDVRLCKNGEWQTVRVDDWFPCRGRKLAYSKGRLGQLWVPLVEKAVAKVHGSYEALDSGTIAEGFAMLTGYPCESFRLMIKGRPAVQSERVDGGRSPQPEPTPAANDDNPNYLWTLLSSYRDADYLLGASIEGSMIEDENGQEVPDPTAVLPSGLLSRHAYSVLDVVSMDDHGHHFRMVKIRNPLGHDRWQGSWSFGAPNWRRFAAVREACRPERCGSGVFWMSYDEFRHHFHNVDVCKVLSKWQEQRCEGYFPAHAEDVTTGFLLKTDRAAGDQIEIGLAQSSLRGGIGTGEITQDMSVCMVELEDPDDVPNGKVLFSSKKRVAIYHSPYSMYTRDLEPDKYYLILPISFNCLGQRPTRRKFIITVYTRETLTMVPKTVSAEDTGHVLAMACKRGKKTEPFPDAGMTFWEYHSMFAAENLNLTQHLVARLEVPAYDNFVCSRSKEILFVEASIPPLSRQFIAAFASIVPEVPANIRFQFHFETHKERQQQVPGMRYPDMHHPREIPGARQRAREMLEEDGCCGCVVS